MREHDILGLQGPKEKAPERAISKGRCNSSDDQATTTSYHSRHRLSCETTPTPQQRIHPARGGGYEVVAIDGYGLQMRAWRPYRYMLADLLDRLGGRLTEAAADIVIGGRR